MMGGPILRVAYLHGGVEGPILRVSNGRPYFKRGPILRVCGRRVYFDGIWW